MKIRTLIVDDEPLARERIRFLLREVADVELVGESDGGEAAVRLIGELNPDLLFLDVQMPELDGFAMLQQLPPETLPVVIFVTAFDQHALRAFDAHALDYLLKPCKPARFQEALERARAQLRNREAGQAAQGLLELLAAARPATPANQPLARLAIKSDDKVVFIPVADIDSLESAGNYVMVHVGKEGHILRETLTNLEARLPAERFMRISRAAIVNLDRVKELQPFFKGESVVVLKNGKVLPTTRSLRDIQKQLESH